MILFHRVTDTLIASLAMPEIFPAPNSAYPTPITMEYLFSFKLIVIEMTHMADVNGKSLATPNTIVFPNLLLKFAPEALNVSNFLSLKMMMLFNVLQVCVPFFIMTKSAGVILQTLGAFLCTSSSIVFAT